MSACVCINASVRERRKKTKASGKQRGQLTTSPRLVPSATDTAVAVAVTKGPFTLCSWGGDVLVFIGPSPYQRFYITSSASARLYHLRCCCCCCCCWCWYWLPFGVGTARFSAASGYSVCLLSGQQQLEPFVGASSGQTMPLWSADVAYVNGHKSVIFHTYNLRGKHCQLRSADVAYVNDSIFVIFVYMYNLMGNSLSASLCFVRGYGKTFFFWLRKLSWSGVRNWSKRSSVSVWFLFSF